MQLHPDAWAVPARIICREANELKAKHHPELAGHRYMSEDTAGRAIRRLIDSGVLLLLDTPEVRDLRRPRRVRRQWKVMPRIFAVPAAPCLLRRRGRTGRRGHWSS